MVSSETSSPATSTLPSSHTQNWTNDGRYDWMDSAIPKNPKVLPKHACDANGNLRADLLEPAPLAFRESYKEGGDAGGDGG